jgi:hypothetical protein
VFRQERADNSNLTVAAARMHTPHEHMLSASATVIVLIQGTGWRWQNSLESLGRN